MKVALTGVSGFIGASTAHALHTEGHGVRGLLRQTSRRDHIEQAMESTVTGSMEDRTCHAPLLDGVDALIHNAFDWSILKRGDLSSHLDHNLTTSIELLTSAARRGLRVVYISSVAVHHDMRPHWEGRIDADHPTRPGSLYGACKVAIEAHLWSLRATEGLNFTIIRPAAVYGIDPVLERSIGAPIISRVREGRRCHRAGGGKFVHVDDVAAAIVRSLMSQEASGKVYHLADCYARWSDWATWTCEHLGTTVDIDDSSPPAPKNMFTKDEIQRDLDLPMDRGPAGIQTHIAALASAMACSGV